ncbi:MFS transporter [Litchfieldia alkalitelluris]|uniref:MFS transporter n=1 Tax=Litchfieldia alkalitelluris TaxID=304268 RepID=UPI0009967F4C|nr:MFS transporter [Litchfieldia alkalitelluris]
MNIVTEWKQQFSSYNSNIKLFFITNICTQIGMGIFMVIYNFYIRELGFNENLNGNIIAMTALASAIILIPAGIISDRLGRKKVMLLGIVTTACALMARSIFEMESFLLIAAFIGGLSNAFIQVSAIPWLAENSNQSQRVHLFSYHAATMMVANVIGNAAGGLLTDTFSILLQIPQIWSIRITLIIASIIFFIGILPIFKMSEQTKVKVNSINKKKFSIKKAWNQNRKHFKLIALFAIAQLIIGFGSGLVIPYLNLYFADRFNTNNSTIGIILSLGQAATAIAMIIGPLVVKKVGEVKAVVYLQLCSLPFLLLTAYTESLLLASIGFLFRQALMNAGNPIQASLMMARVDDSMKGFANSVNQMVFSLGWALMGPVSTSIVVIYGAYWGYAYVFSITASLYLIGSLYFYFMFKDRARMKPQQTFAKIS